MKMLLLILIMAGAVQPNTWICDHYPQWKMCVNRPLNQGSKPQIQEPQVIEKPAEIQKPLEWPPVVVSPPPAAEPRVEPKSQPAPTRTRPKTPAKEHKSRPGGKKPAIDEGPGLPPFV